MNLALFLRDLGPARATWLFLVALLFGTAMVLFDWGSILAWVLLPTIPIVVYSLALGASQVRYSVSHTPEIKTSPYILGFLLTLIALFGLFLRGGEDLISGDIDRNIMVGQIGAAIMTTAVGLVCRQVLITTDPAHDQREKVFRSLAGDLRRNATDFEMAQKRLVSLITEFVSTREELFEKEEQAFRKFMDGLERGSQILTEIETTYPKRLQASLATFHKNINTLDKAVGEAVKNVGDLSVAAKDGSDGIVSTGKTVEELLSQSAQQWDQASRDLAVTLTSSTESLKLAADESLAVQNGLGDIQEAMQAVVQQLQLLPEQTSQIVQSIGMESTAAHENVASLVSNLLQDVKAVDAVMDEVTTLLTKHVERLKNNG